MRSQKPCIKAGIALLALLFLQGCATELALMEVKNTLPPDRLAYYNDPFDDIREDLWDRSGLLHQREQLIHYKPAEMRIEDGQLLIRSQVGAFSKGGLVSQYELRGDFDVQVDCHIDFLKQAGELDQIMAFAIVEKVPARQKNRLVAISLLQKAGEGSGIFSSYRDGWTILGKSWSPTGDFHGSLRIIRKGDKVTTFYRKEGRSWEKADIFPSTGNDARVGLGVQNFTWPRKSIDARAAVVGRFDNFRINGAQEIVESEI